MTLSGRHRLRPPSPFVVGYLIYSVVVVDYLYLFQAWCAAHALRALRARSARISRIQMKRSSKPNKMVRNNNYSRNKELNRRERGGGRHLWRPLDVGHRATLAAC